MYLGKPASDEVRQNLWSTKAGWKKETQVLLQLPAPTQSNSPDTASNDEAFGMKISSQKK